MSDSEISDYDYQEDSSGEELETEAEFIERGAVELWNNMVMNSYPYEEVRNVVIYVNPTPGTG